MPCTHGPRHPYPLRPKPLPLWDRLDWFRSGAEWKHVSADLDQYSCASPYPSLAGCSPWVPVCLPSSSALLPGLPLSSASPLSPGVRGSACSGEGTPASLE